MKHLLTFSLLSLTAQLHADTAPADPNLATAIRRAFFLAPDAPITEEHFNNLTHLRVTAYSTCDDDDCTNNALPLTQLDGLECAPYLTNLRLVGNKSIRHEISDTTPIKGLTRLKKLELDYALSGSHEQLTSSVENISNISSLRTLTLEGNSLDTENVSSLENLPNLRALDIDNNNLSEITPLNELTQIRVLDIDDNPILNFSPLTKMQWIRDLDLTSFQNGFHTLPPLRGLSSLKVVAEDFGPIARQSQLRFIEVTSDSLVHPAPRLRDLTPLANLPSDELYFYTHLISNAVQDFRAITFKRSSDFSNLFKQILRDAAVNSRADFSDPETAALFQEYEILEEELSLYTQRGDKLIPDGALRANIRTQLGISQDPSREDLLALNSLTSKSVDTLTGLDLAENLNSLTCTNGWITTLSPIKDIEHLTELDLKNNFISDVSPLKDLPLTSIDLRGNPIDQETIPQAWFDNDQILFDRLEPLDSSETIPDPALRSAIRIALGIPPTSPLGAEDLTQLKTLYADTSNIRSLEGLEFASNLQSLSLRNNIIKDLSPLPTTSLRWVRISGNPLTNTSMNLVATLQDDDISIDNNEDARFLSAITPVDGVVYADSYQLSSLRYLPLFPDVKTLHLSGNYLQDIKELCDLPNLQIVYLNGNLLDLTPDSAAHVTITLLRNRGVDVIDSDQRVETALPIPVEQDLLRRALADGLGLPFVPPTFSDEQLASITRFDWERSAGNAPLSDPAFISKLTALEYLSLEAAGISDISFVQNLTQLKTLDLDFNDITDLTPLSGLTNLEELDLNDNNILMDLDPLSNLADLASLDLDDNQISDLAPLSSLTALVELDLHQNKISGANPLSSLENLEILNISTNQLTDITPISRLGSLRELYASYNVIPFHRSSQMELLEGLRTSVNRALLSPQIPSDVKIVFEEDTSYLEWSTEPNTSYHLFSSDTLEPSFDFIQSYSTAHTFGTIRYPFDLSAKNKGFFRVSLRRE